MELGNYTDRPDLSWKVLGRVQQLPQRLGVRREKEPVFLAAGRCFRFDDVRQTRDGNLDTVDDKLAAFVPDALEIEAGHHEREVDLQVASRGARQSAALDNGFGDDAIVRRIERLVARPQREAGRFAGVPCAHQIVGIRRKEESSVLRCANRAASGCKIVCACDSDEHKSNVTCNEFAHKLLKLVVHDLSPLNAAIMIEEF